MDTRKRGRRCAWPEALKREIVAAAAAPGASASIVARTYEVNTTWVFTWWRLYGTPPPPAAKFVPVVVEPDQPTATQPAQAADAIEIELARRYRVRIDHSGKAASLRLVLDAPEWR